MVRNPIVILVAVVILLGLSAGSAFATGRALGERAGAEKAREETIEDLQSQFRQALATAQQQQSAATAQSGAGTTSEQTPAAAQAAPAGGGFFAQGGAQGGGRLGGGAAALAALGGGVTGRVEKIEGDRVTLTVAQGGSSITAVIGQSTTVRKAITGARSDIKAGSEVILQGQRQTDGGFQASTIIVTSS